MIVTKISSSVKPLVIHIAMFAFGLLCLNHTFGQTTTPFIKIDQFGYLTSAKKVAVINDPQSGFNASESFSPSTNTNQYQIRRVSDNVAVFTGTLSAWKNGATHAQSGDRGWYFDFSSLTTAGAYYVYDVGLNLKSYHFDISDNVYGELLKHALRTFYYQRLGVAKSATHAGTKWADAICYNGANQDRFARLYSDPNNATTARDLSGGWMDAGDVNKYTTFAEKPMIQLIEAYRANPSIFLDNYNIPESGNATPDILDELKFELDFLKKMQDATGTNGFFLKIGNIDYNVTTPLSADNRPRYYVGECTAATLAGAAIFAACGQGFKQHVALISYGNDLITRAENAWIRAKTTTNNFTSFETNCDNGTVKSGDADRSASEQLSSAFIAAVYLFEATGKQEYKTFIDNNYSGLSRYSWWGPYDTHQQLAMLRYASLATATTAVANNIRAQKANMNYQNSINNYNANDDLYRAHRADGEYGWGSNHIASDCGNINLDFITFNVNTSNHTQYKEVAEQYLHWLHGVNPIGIAMLSNMDNYGSEKSVNEIYHTWFADGSSWDNAKTSTNGPAPAYLTGGPNKTYTGSLFSTGSEPAQKCYREVNSFNNIEKSWEITEPAIYYQAAYIAMLSRLMQSSPLSSDTQVPTTPSNLIASNVTQTSLTLSWTASTDNIGVVAYEVYQNGSLINGNVSATSLMVSGLTCGTNYTFWVKAKDAANNISAASNSLNVGTTNCVAPTSTIIYADALASGWENWSWSSTLNFANTSPVQQGINSLSATIQGWAGVSLRSANGIAPTSNTFLNFAVFSTTANTINVYIQTTDGGNAIGNYTFNTVPNQWQVLSLNMAQMGNPSLIKRVTFQNSSVNPISIVLDNINIGTPSNLLNIKLFLNNIDASSNLMPSYWRNLANFPLSDPYRNSPYNSTFIHVNNGFNATIAPASLNITGANAIVDWVFLSLESDAGAATTVAATKAALLQSDGDIVGTNGTSLVQFDNVPAGSYYLKIAHRNHLAFRTLNKITLGTNTVNLDLTAPNTTSLGPLQNVSSTKKGLIGGDANFDGSIDAFDTIEWEQENGLFDNYFLNSDYNMDGSTDAFDSLIWELNNGLFYP
jgi:endoglucanase